MAFKAGAGLGPVTLISCVTDRIDAFVVGTDGGVYTSALWSGATAWTIWTRIGYSQAAPCAPITAVSTASGMIDLFFVDTSGRVITASTNYPVGTHLASFSWGSEVPDPQGLNLKTTLHAPITVVDLVGGGLVLLLFAVGLDGRVHMNMRWGGTWAGWSALGENILVDQLALVLAPPGAPIAAASIRRSDNWELELFVVGNDSFIYWNAVKSGLNWRGWKKLDGAPLIAPRTPITGIWRNTNYLDIFFTDGTAKVVKTARLLSTTTFPFVDRSSFKTALGSVIPARTPVTAVSMAPDRIDIFAIDDEGRVVWNGNSPGQSWTSNAFRVVNTDMFTQPAIAVGAVSRALYKLDVAVPRTTDGFVVTAAWELKDLWTGFRGWSQIGSLQTGMRDPRLGLWLRRAVINAWIGTEGSEEAQGVTTDDVGHWFLTSNHNCDGNYQSVRRYDRYFGLLQKWYLGDVHPGAADCFDGKIFVPLEYYSYQGIWKAHWSFTDRSIGTIKGKDFPYCTVNPLNGRLYGSDSAGTLHMLAYDLEFANGALVRRPEDDILLAQPDREFADIQGGVFTRGGRILIVRGTTSGPSTLFCFSAITGGTLGSLDLNPELDRYGKTSGREVESVTVRPWWLSDGTRVDVHILELDNDWWPCWAGGNYDDCYLHSFIAWEPDLL